MTSAEERNDLTAASEGAEAAEREKMLKNGQQTAEKDVEKEQSSAAKEPLGTSDRSALIGAVELERFRNDPFWKGLRVALFGGLALLFLGLVLAAVSIVVLRPKCAAPLPEFADQQALPSNGTTNTETPNASSEPVFYDDQQPAPSYLMDDPLQKPTDPAASPVGVRPRVDSYIMIASAGEPVHFRCWQCQFQKCQNSQALHWRRVHSPEALPVERDEQSAFLIFQRVQLADAGVYECVDGTSRVASSPVHLRVEPPRTPVIHSLDQLVEENSQAFLHCSVPGHPEAQLSWRLENGVDARRLPGIVDDGRGTLRIEPVAEEHQRHGFVCWAVYPRRADKQALHAGPARIRLAKKEEEEPAAAGDGEVHPTAEEEEEAGEGKEAEAEEKPEDQKQQQQQQVDDQASGTPAEKEEPNQERNEKQQQPAEKEDPFGAEEEEDEEMLSKAEEMPQIPVENDQPTETDNAGQGQQTEAEEGSGEAMIQIEPLLNAVKAIAMESGEQQQQNRNGQQTEEEEGREDKTNGIRRKKRNV